VGLMLRMESVQNEILDRVEDTLRSEFMSNLAQTQRRDSHEAMAEIFIGFDRQTEARFLTALEERDRESAEKIKALMFTFEDLIRLDGAGAQTLLRHVETEKLALSLKGGSDGLKELYFANMWARAAKLLKDNMQGLGAAREEGYIKGHTAALEEASTAREHYVADAVNLIAQGLGKLEEKQQAANEALAVEAMRMTFAVIRKLIPELGQQYALDNVDAF